MPKVQVNVPSEYDDISNENYGTSNFGSTETPQQELPEINYYNSEGLKSDIDGNAITNSDGTYTDKDGHTIMADENGKPIMPQDAPEYYDWYDQRISAENSFIETAEEKIKSATETIGKMVETNPVMGTVIGKINTAFDDLQHKFSPESSVTVGTQELTQQDIDNGYTIGQDEFDIPRRYNNLGEMHPDDRYYWGQLVDAVNGACDSLQEYKNVVFNAYQNGSLVKVVDDTEYQKALIKAETQDFGRGMIFLLPWVGTGGLTSLIKGVKNFPKATEGIDVVMEKIGSSVKGSSNAVNEVKYLEYQPSSGVELKTTPGETTTILGNYNKDTQHIVGELGNVKSTDFGPRIDDFNVLNVPDELYVNPKQFWNEYNQPWLDNVISREDNILMATKPEFGPESLLFRQNPITGKFELSGFGKEYYHLRNNGYIFDLNSMQMIPK